VLSIEELKVGEAGAWVWWWMLGMGIRDVVGLAIVALDLRLKVWRRGRGTGPPYFDFSRFRLLASRILLYF
jgi:hypothetical protein